ncbi:C69 family dipeptidase [Lentilactobacillus buchneri]|nr:C69 family dipeptidase [Lentilactobacillus sp. Egmn17]
MMVSKHLSACTTVLVGKKASIDGSTMIARNDDTFLPLTPQRFYVEPANDHQTGEWASNQNGFKAPLPKQAYRYSLTPNVEVDKEGVYAESGFNEKNVAMSATESVYGNERALAFDPLVKDGLAEDSLQSMVLPYIDSARDGVQYLGKLIKQYGSPEAIAANQVAIQQVKFDDPDNFMYSDGIQEFVEKYHLNTDKQGFNFRHIFGTDNEKDRHYNTPRVWFGQKYLNPEIEQSPTSSNLPFICHTDHKISVEDVEYILSSHYNETPYDPFSKGHEDTKTLFRPISMNRTQNSHVLQIRNDLKNNSNAIMWLCFGVPAFSPYVPFFANATDTDDTYANTPVHCDDVSAYWMYRKLSMLVESHYSEFIQDDVDFLTDMKEQLRRHVQSAIDESQALKGEELTSYLTEQNHEVVKMMRIATEHFNHQLIEKGLTLSKLTFNMDKNL